MNKTRPVISHAVTFWTGIVAFVASVVQLATVPWSTPVKVGLAGALVLCGVALVAHAVGRRRVEPPRGTGGDRLSGARFIKVPKTSGNVSVCDFHPDGRLTERRVPLSPARIESSHAAWPGQWYRTDGELHVVVRGYHLTLQRGDRGLWTGAEEFWEASEHFLGAVVDRQPIEMGRPWNALKLSDSGAIRFVVADGGGTLRERDGFDLDSDWPGVWRVRDGQVHVEIEHWHLAVRPWMPGIYVGTEVSADGNAGFALVRVMDD